MALRRVHIVGGGLAGLSAAVAAVGQGIAPIVYEAAGRAGGRCRSFHDPSIGLTIDNGNHLLLRGNKAARDYVHTIGADDALISPDAGQFPFFDAQSGQRWQLRPGKGVWPGWLFDPTRRVPQTRPIDYLQGLRFLHAGQDDRCGDLVGPSSRLYRNFWQPLIVSAINCAPQAAAAQLMRPVLTQTFAKGAKGATPMIAKDSLAEALVDPAIAYIEQRGGTVRLGTRVQALTRAPDRLSGIRLAHESIDITGDEAVIVAVPSWQIATLLPMVTAPPAGEPIVNVHFRLDAPFSDRVEIIGIIGGFAHWVFTRPGLASITISAAAAEARMDNDDIATASWRDVHAALALPADLREVPPYRVVKEKRATFAQDPQSIRLRTGPEGPFDNVALAGDWTATGLPATIEGAIRSGRTALRHLAKQAGMPGTRRL